MAISSTAEKSEFHQREVVTRVICVTSGKGGVGKTNVTVNLAYALTLLGKKVLILDADLSLANVDVLLGVYPKYNMGHVLKGEKTISEIVTEGPGGMMIIPGSSGIQELTQLTDQQKMHLLSDVELLAEPVDVLLIDTASGISSNVLYFAMASEEVMMISSPEPTSLTDVYALMKLLSVRQAVKHFMLLVNGARSIEEASGVFQNLSMVADKFLDVSIEYLGCIPDDVNLPRAVRQQKAIVQKYPNSLASIGFTALAKRVCELPVPQTPSGNIRFFWNRILRGSNGTAIKTA